MRDRKGKHSILDAIYLDTASVLSTVDAPSKVHFPYSVFYLLYLDIKLLQKHATDDLVQLMSILPSSTLFFLNTWTWGYEDILMAVAKAFNTKVILVFHLLFCSNILYTLLRSTWTGTSTVSTLISPTTLTRPSAQSSLVITQLQDSMLASASIVVTPSLSQMKFLGKNG